LINSPYKGNGFWRYLRVLFLQAYGCHEHTVSNILSAHREEGISNLTNCASCHKSSNKHEGREGSGREREGDDDDGN